MNFKNVVSQKAQWVKEKIKEGQEYISEKAPMAGSFAGRVVDNPAAASPI